MASTAFSAQGSTLKIDNVTLGVPDVPIANMKSFSGFDGEASEIDITNLSSTAKEFTLGIQDFGAFSFDWNPDFSDAGQNVVRAASGTANVKTFLLTLPDGTTVTFTGLVKNAKGLSGGVDATVDGSVSIKITGTPVYA